MVIFLSKENLPKHLLRQGSINICIGYGVGGEVSHDLVIRRILHKGMILSAYDSCR